MTTYGRVLEDNVALVYGSGPIGGAIARGFALAGARVFLAGRTGGTLERAAGEIREAGGVVETALVDALDEHSVDRFVDQVAETAGSVDITCNVIGYGDVHQPLTEISVDDFLRPILNATRSHFLTARAAVRHMIPQRAGVILAFGGTSPKAIPGLGGFTVALDAVESLRRQWAVELGQYGIRVVTLRTGGIPDSIPDDFDGKDVITESIVGDTLLGRAATVEDVGTVAAFVASDLARTMTCTEVNISCGAIPE